MVESSVCHKTNHATHHLTLILANHGTLQEVTLWEYLQSHNTLSRHRAISWNVARGCCWKQSLVFWVFCTIITVLLKDSWCLFFIEAVENFTFLCPMPRTLSCRLIVTKVWYKFMAEKNIYILKFNKMKIKEVYFFKVVYVFYSCKEIDL